MTAIMFNPVRTATQQRHKTKSYSVVWTRNASKSQYIEGLVSSLEILVVSGRSEVMLGQDPEAPLLSGGITDRFPASALAMMCCLIMGAKLASPTIQSN